MKNSYNILLVGAGQLGSRHLQGLAKSKYKLNIYIVEPNENNIKTAIERFNEIEGYKNHQLFSFSKLNMIDEKQIDIAILATNADVRYSVTKEMVNLFNINQIIFEKVVFQSENQFEEIIDLLKNNEIKSWVNCPRRSINYYQQLKKELENKGPIHLEAEGVDWGLACNSVHHIDLLAFLTGDPNYEITQNLLEDKIYQSKRAGFIEFFGSFSGESSTKHSFTLNCNTKSNIDEKTSLSIKIKSPDEIIFISEGLGKAEFYKLGEVEPFKTDSFQMMFQSSLTNLQVDEIIENGSSSLTSLKESFLIHEPFLKLLRNQNYKISNTELKNIPIT